MNKLWLIWQNEDTRKKYHIGTLTKQKDHYFFEYSNKYKFRGLRDAQKNGYSYLFPFKDLDKKYRNSVMFPTFTKRLPSKSRPDYVKLLKMFGLDENASDMEILRITKGKTGVDNYEFITPLTVEGNKLDTQFFIEGIRHYDFSDIANPEKYFEENPELNLIKDPMVHDSTAIKILTKNNHVLGYIPAVYSKILTEMMDCTRLKLNVSHVNRDTLPQLALYVNIKASIPLSFLNEFSDDFEIMDMESRV
ncbi:HIRAN domain-containing protein [Salinicoccus albus]|uniref:HIRAN domain-containing protein n=1 Tax=Salinicoccus albus TaxID=418756 RepID=UPI00035E4A20|nr:HIRAN domain-containing protein [Salinicoccus albus]